MPRANFLAPNLILVFAAAWAIMAVAWAGATDRRVFENAARYLPISRYEAAARLDRLSVHDGAELRIWQAHDLAAGGPVATGHVIRPGGMATYWLLAGERGAIDAVAFSINEDIRIRRALAPLLAELSALEPLWGACGWSSPDYEIEAIHRGERLHFRFDRACAQNVPALRRLVALIGL